MEGTGLIEDTGDDVRVALWLAVELNVGAGLSDDVLLKDAVIERVGVPVRVMLRVPDRELAPVRELLGVPVERDDAVAVTLAVDVRVALVEYVPVVLDEMVLVALGEVVPVGVNDMLTQVTRFFRIVTMANFQLSSATR